MNNKIYLDYIEDSVEYKIQSAKKILHGVANPGCSQPTTSMYNQEDEENYNANVAASSLMLLHCSSKEGRQ
jgi:hypothetical protein